MNLRSASCAPGWGPPPGGEPRFIGAPSDYGFTTIEPLVMPWMAASPADFTAAGSL
jgi:hypothetical protein